MHALGEAERGREAIDAAQEALGSKGAPELQAHIWLEIGHNHLVSGDAQKAIGAYSNAAEAWQQVGAPHRLAHSLLGVAAAYGLEQQWARTEEYSRRALAIEHDVTWVRSAALNNLGEALHHLGRHDEAAMALLEAEDLMRADRDLAGLAHCLATQGEVLLAQDRLQQAVAKLTEAVDWAREIDRPAAVCLGAALLASAHIRLGDRAAAEKSLGVLTLFDKGVHDPRVLRAIDEAQEQLAALDAAQASAATQKP
jgi:tetratricopeptide (TPR) repeat protein